MSQPLLQDRRAKIAEAIRAELARQGKSRAAFASAINISPATLTRRLRGQYPFYLEELEAAAQFLGLPLSELTARTDANT